LRGKSAGGLAHLKTLSRHSTAVRPRAILGRGWPFARLNGLNFHSAADLLGMMFFCERNPGLPAYAFALLRRDKRGQHRADGRSAFDVPEIPMPTKGGK
jgi:hypothetical protein